MKEKIIPPSLSISPTTQQDFEQIVNYFFSSSENFHRKMGVDKRLLGDPRNWYEPFEQNLKLPDEKKDRFFLTWKVDDIPIGHAHLNKIEINRIACIHLHIWKAKNRRLGYGTNFIKMSTDYLVKRFRLKVLLGEPYMKNTAPNKALLAAGFDFLEVVPPVSTRDKLNYKQAVNRYILKVKGDQTEAGEKHDDEKLVMHTNKFNLDGGKSQSSRRGLKLHCERKNKWRKISC